jgi:hypothetical protein
MAVSHILSSPIANMTGTVTVFNSLGSTVTANATDLVRPQDWNSVHNQFMTIAGNTAGASTMSGTNIVFQGGNNVTLSANAQTLVFSAASQTVQTQNIVSVNGSTGGISLNVGSSLSSSTNGSSITFGLASNITTALQSAGAYLTTAALSNHSHNFATTTTGGALIVVGTTNSNGATIGVPSFLTTAMQSNAATISNINVSAGTTSNNLSALTFNNGNGVSFGLDAGVMTASVAAAGGAQTGVSGISAGTTQATSGTVSFADGNGVSFGMNGNTMTASVAAAGGAQTAISGLVVSNTTYTSGTVSFRDGNNISFASGTGQAVSITHNLQSAGAYLTTARASNDAIGLNTALTANGVSMTANSSGLSLNFPAFLTTAAQSNQVVNSLQGSAGQITFSASNGITFGGNASTITASHNGLTSQSNQNITAANGGFAFQTLSFSNLNGISFGTSAGSAITASHNGLTTAAQSNHSHNFATTTTGGSLIVVGTTNSAGATIGVPAFITTSPAQTNQTGNLYVTANSTQLSSSAGIDLRSLSFAGAGIASVGVSNGVVLVSVPSGGGAGDGVNIVQAGTTGTTGTTFSSSAGTVFINGGNNITVSQNGSNQIVISAAQGGIAAGSQTATSGTLVFANSNGITFGMSGSSQITASVNAGGGGATISNWEPYAPLGGNTAFSTLGQNTIYLQRLQPPVNVAFANIERRMSGSFVSSTNSQAATHTYDYGLYSRGTGASTSIYSQIGSSQIIYQASISSNVSAGFTISQGAASFTSTSAGTALFSLLSGFKHMYLPYAGTMTAGGDYAVAMRMSSATAIGTNALRIGVQDLSVINNLTIGKVFATTALASNASFVGDFAQGVYSASSSNLPSTIALSGLTNAVSQQRMYLQFDN